jgi:hypothetical protein
MDDEKEFPPALDLDNLPPGVTVMEKMPDGSPIPEGVTVIQPGADHKAKHRGADAAAMLTAVGAAALGHSGMGMEADMIQHMFKQATQTGSRMSVIGPTRNLKKQKRNAPCGCGSDLKAKRCCGDYPKAQREL